MTERSGEPSRRRALPSGRVTFLMTDIEGSTRLQQRLGADYAAIAHDHDRLLATTITSYGGTVVDHTGDGLFAVFPSAPDAVSAAAEAQRALAVFAWPAGEQVRVRMGLHTAEAAPIGDAYVSLAVNRTARVMAAGHGGQVLLTSETATAAGDALDVVRGGLGTRDLGTYRLKDFDEPTVLLQLTGQGLPASFPSLRALPASAHNVPAILAEFVGRDAELEAVNALIDEHRLVTVVGPGGVGKTRLAFELARQRAPLHPAGAWVVFLAGLSDPSLVAPTVASTVGVPVHSSTELMPRLSSSVGVRDMLLVLDNCEHLVESVSELVRSLLAAGPHVRVLVTSREPLRLPGERTWRLEPLAVPDAVEVDLMWASDSVRLFVDRARSADARFELTDGNADAVATICRELDGIPLALELAAARTRHLPVRAVAARLADKLTLLRRTDRGDPGAAAHQATLTTTLDWSWESLDAVERVVLRRVAVFQVPFAFEAAERVVGVDALDGRDALEVLSALVDKSLLAVVADAEVLTYRMLVVIRDYAIARLEQSGELEQARDAHLRWVCDAVADAPTCPLDIPRSEDWTERVERLLPDLRVARRHAEAVGDDAAMLAIATRISRFGFRTFRFTEALDWADQTLAVARPEPRDLWLWLWLMYSATLLAAIESRQTQVEWLDRVERLEEALAQTEQPPPGLTASVLHCRADYLRICVGDRRAAVDVYRQALEIAATPQHATALRRTIAECLFDLGEIDEAVAIDAEAIATFEQLGDEFELFRTLQMAAAHLQQARTSPGRAGRYALRSLQIASARSWLLPIETVTLLADLARDVDVPAAAVRVLSALATALATSSEPRLRARLPEIDQALDELRPAVGPSYDGLVAEGRTLDLMAAAELVVAAAAAAELDVTSPSRG